MKLRPLFAALLFACAPVLHAQGNATPIEDTAFGLAKGSVFDTATPKPYTFEGAGAGKFIPPPPGMPTMIPHPIDAHLPIAVDRNACLGCHDRPADLGKKLARSTPRPMPANHYVERDGKRVLSGGAVQLHVMPRAAGRRRRAREEHGFTDPVSQVTSPRKSELRRCRTAPHAPSRRRRTNSVRAPVVTLD